MEKLGRYEGAIVLVAILSGGIVLALIGTLIFNLLTRYGISGVVTFYILLGAIILLAAAGFALDAGKGETGVFPAALRATVAAVPVTAGLSTVVFYVVSNIESSVDGYHAVLTGSLTALLVWLVAALFYRGSAAAGRASLRNYNSLREELGWLESQLEHVKPKHSGWKGARAHGVDQHSREIAYAHARKECAEVKKGLEGRGLPWVKGTGYIELWHRVHRAEEALIMIVPLDAVIVGAMRDELRLLGSTMVDKDSLLERLRCAVAMLDDSEKDERAIYLAEPPQDPPPEDRKNHAKARTILSEVRYEINNFRDDVWEGIVHARNRLVATSVFTGFAVYALLGLAVVANAPGHAVFWAVIYFLVGAIVGLFARSQIDAKADTAVDDHGLSTARLAHAPLFSGLAAVGGVLIVSVLDTQIPTSEAGSGAARDLFAGIFTGSPSLLIIAAVFGLTPDLLIQRLTQQAEKYKADLKSSGTGQRR